MTDAQDRQYLAYVPTEIQDMLYGCSGTIQAHEPADESGRRERLTSRGTPNRPLRGACALGIARSRPPKGRENGGEGAEMANPLKRQVLDRKTCCQLRQYGHSTKGTAMMCVVGDTICYNSACIATTVL